MSEQEKFLDERVSSAAPATVAVSGNGAEQRIAGRKLDAEIAEKVFGCDVAPCYSTDIAAAWGVQEFLENWNGGGYFYLRLERTSRDDHGDDSLKWAAQFYLWGASEGCQVPWTYAAAAPLAICLAALAHFIEAPDKPREGVEASACSPPSEEDCAKTSTPQDPSGSSPRQVTAESIWRPEGGFWMRDLAKLSDAEHARALDMLVVNHRRRSRSRSVGEKAGRVTRHVVMFSAGAGSFEAAWRVVQRHGRHAVTLLFADTLCEDADAYRFLVEGAAFLLGYGGRTEVSGVAARAANTPPAWERDARKAHLIALRPDVVRLMPNLAWVQEGRDIWDVFEDERFLGNSRVGVCTRTLKQEMADRWCNQHCDPATTIRYVGIDWTEIHRYEGDGHKRKGLKLILSEQGWRCEAPLCEAPWITKADVLDHMRALGIKPPRLYDLGFQHNNCGGGCVKAGIGHFAHLYRALPDVFAHWEREENRLRDMLGQGAHILSDRAGGGGKRPLPLATLRARIENGEAVDQYEIGGCGCFIDTEAA